MSQTSDKGLDSYVLDENGAPAFMGVSPKTLQSWRSRRMGPPYVRIARRCIRYRKTDLQAYMDERVVAVQRQESA